MACHNIQETHLSGHPGRYTTTVSTSSTRFPRQSRQLGGNGVDRALFPRASVDTLTWPETSSALQVERLPAPTCSKLQQACLRQEASLQRSSTPVHARVLELVRVL